MPCLHLCFVIYKMKIQSTVNIYRGFDTVDIFTVKVVRTKLEGLSHEGIIAPTDSEGTGRTWAKVHNLA